MFSALLQEPTLRYDGPEVPPETCDFCELPLDMCQCDSHDGAYLLTDIGRTYAHEMPNIRQAYRQAARNGNGGICRVLEGIAPDLTDAREEYDVCDTCGGNLPECWCEVQDDQPERESVPFGYGE